MKKYLAPILPILLFFFSCTPDVAEEKIYHSTDLQHELWKDDTTAREQVYTLKEDTVTTIVFEGGTKIVIPANAFVPEENPAQPIEGEVELRVVEVRQQNDLLRYHLSTQEEGGKLLDTARMLNLEAYAGGKELQLKEGKEILLGFPKEKGLNELALFSGIVATNGLMRWKENDVPVQPQQALLDIYFPGGVPEGFRLLKEESKNTAKQNPGSDGSLRVFSGEEELTAYFSLAENAGDYHFFRSSSLDWLSYNRQVEEKVAKLQLDIRDYPANTLYYLVYDNLNAVSVGQAKAGEPEESTTVFEQLPVGRKGELIVIYHKEGDYFLAHQPLTIEESQALQLEPVKIEKKAIRSFLKKFSRPTS